MPARMGNPERRRRHFIKEWREFRGYSQEKLGALVSTSKANISRIEDLKQGYTQDGLEAIADALGTHVAALLTRPPNEQDAIQAAPPGRAQRVR